MKPVISPTLIMMADLRLFLCQMEAWPLAGLIGKTLKNPGVFKKFPGIWAGANTHLASGVGDINGDGLSDVIAQSGWWEQPAKNSDKGKSIVHAFVFSTEIWSQMLVHDVNDDGKNNIISSLHNHSYGLAWFEQKKSDNETPH